MTDPALEALRPVFRAIQRDAWLLAAMLAADAFLALVWFAPIGAVLAAVVLFIFAANLASLVKLSPRPAYWTQARRNATFLWIALPASWFLVPRLRANLALLEAQAFADPKVDASFNGLEPGLRGGLAEAWATLLSARDLGVVALILSVLLAIVLPGSRFPAGSLIVAVGVLALDGLLVVPLAGIALALVRRPTPGRLRGLQVLGALLLLVPPLGTACGAAVLWQLRRGAR